MLPLPESCRNSSHVDHDFTSFFLRFAFILEGPIAYFGVYCILKLTPKHLLQAKILLLAHEAWITFYSAMICIGLTPVAFFPYIAFYGRGVFEMMELEMVWVIYLLGTGFGGMLFSILCLFAYRHQSILPESHFLKLKPSRFLLLCILIHSGTIFFMIPFSLNSPDQEFSLISLQSSYQSPPCDLWHPRLFIYWFGVWKVMVGYMIFLAGCSGLMVFCVAHSFRIIKVYQRITSKNTRKRQIGFLYALTLMASIPNLCLFLPTFAFVICSNDSSSYHAVISDIIVCVVGLHGLLSTMTMILSHKPYRKEAMALLRKLVWWKKEKPKRVIFHCDTATKTARF